MDWLASWALFCVTLCKAGFDIHNPYDTPIYTMCEREKYYYDLAHPEPTTQKGKN